MTAPPSIRTQQYDSTQKDCDERSSTQAGRAAQSLSITQLLIPFTVTGAHPHGEGTSAALHGVVAVCDHHGDQVDALVEAAVAGSARQDAGSIIWGRQSSLRWSQKPAVELSMAQRSGIKAL